MTEMPTFIQDLKNNYNVDYWSELLDKYDQRLTELHKDIDSSKYTEWALIALSANQGNNEAKSLVSNMLQPDSNEKKIIDEMALIYLIQPIIRHYLFRASNKAQEDQGKRR
jgi:hypothetical protein